MFAPEGHDSNDNNDDNNNDDNDTTTTTTTDNNSSNDNHNSNGRTPFIRDIVSTYKSERAVLGRSQKQPQEPQYIVLATFCFFHLSNNCSQELFKPRCGSLLFA